MIHHLTYYFKRKIHQLTYTLAMPSFKENLRAELDFQGLTVKELSIKTGIIKGTLDNYLGVRSSIPPADIAVRIAKALNVSVEYLVTGEISITQKQNIPADFIAIERDLKNLPKQVVDSVGEMIHTLARTELNLQRR